jgi:hypothetical protein
MTMCNHERLLDYLYGELTEAERQGFQHHLDGCADCRAELAELSGTRLALASWSPPDAELGFRIVRSTAPEPRRASWTFRPAWGLAAAAALVLAAAAAIANVEMRYDAGGLVVRTGWTRGGTAPASVAVADRTSEEWRVRVQQLDARLRQMEQQSRPVTAAIADKAAAPDSGSRMSDAEVIRAMRRLIAESETRQQRELALRVTQVIRDFDVTRATDLARVEHGMRQIQGLTDAELIQQRNTLNQLLRLTRQR